MIWMPGAGISPKLHSLLTDDVVATLAEAQIQRYLLFKRILSVSELRRSCGVTSPGCNVSVRLPPRYTKGNL